MWIGESLIVLSQVLQISGAPWLIYIQVLFTEMQNTRNDRLLCYCSARSARVEQTWDVTACMMHNVACCCRVYRGSGAEHTVANTGVGHSVLLHKHNFPDTGEMTLKYTVTLRSHPAVLGFALQSYILF